MSDVVKSSRAINRLRVRKILLLLAIVSSPFGCCGCIFLLDVLPSSFIPFSTVDFTLNLFEVNVKVENKSDETLYITPITTTYGRPTVIPQLAYIRQRDFPLHPNDAISLTYDSADMPLSGIAVCRENEDCRLLAVDNSDVYLLDSFEDLPKLEPGWFSAIQSHPKYSFGIILFSILGILPVVLFSSWLYLGRLQKTK